MPPTPTQTLYAVPLPELIALLLRQFRRLLSQSGISLSTEDIAHISAAAAQRQPLANAQSICGALAALVTDSLDLLQSRFGRSFAQSLAADMLATEGWVTTAEFLEIAEVKSNAELRVASGAALLALLGDARHAHHLLTVIDHDAGAEDVDAIFARRALASLCGIAVAAPDWRQQVAERLAAMS